MHEYVIVQHPGDVPAVQELGNLERERFTLAERQNVVGYQPVLLLTIFDDDLIADAAMAKQGRNNMRVIPHESPARVSHCVARRARHFERRSRFQKWKAAAKR